MGLLDRLLGDEDPNLSVHAFAAALAEYERGAVTGAQVVSAFNLTGAEATRLQDFLDNIDSAGLTRAIIDDVLILGTEGYYSKAIVQSRLGV
jgi:hypothetical protein